MHPTPPAIPEVARRRTGEPTTLAAMVRRFHGILLHRIRQQCLRCGDPVRRSLDPEDALQSAWLRVYHALAGGRTFANRRALAAYVLRVARHRIADAARHVRGRRRRRHPDESFGVSCHDVPSHEADPAAEAAANDTFATFLARLPAEQAEAVRETVAGLSPADITQRMGVSKRKVQMLLRRARERCREQFADPQY